MKNGRLQYTCKSDERLGKLRLHFSLQTTGQLLDTEFQPTVTAMCQPGYMNIRVNFNQSFVGAVHARGHNKDYRKPPCMVAGNGSNHVTLSVDLYALPDSSDYCGIVVNNVSIPFLFPNFVHDQNRYFRVLLATIELIKLLINETNYIRPSVTASYAIIWDFSPELLFPHIEYPVQDYVHKTDILKLQCSQKPVLCYNRFLLCI